MRSGRLAVESTREGWIEQLPTKDESLRNVWTDFLLSLTKKGESSRLTAATPMENPYCSCKLTRVRPAVRGRDGRRAQGAGGHPGVHASFVRRLRSSPLSALCSLPPFFSALCSPPPFFSVLRSLPTACAR